MKTLVNQVVGDKVKYALIALALVMFAVFVVLPLLPQVDSSLAAVSLRAGISFGEGDAGGDGAGPGDGAGATDGSCCGGPGSGDGIGNSDPGDSSSPGGGDTSGDGGTPPPPPNHDPYGYLDNVSCESISGWARDVDASTIDVHIYIDKQPMVGDMSGFVASVPANQYRGDLCSAIGSCNHGFSFATPARFRDGNTHRVWVYGINIPQGNNPVLGNSPKEFTCPLPPPPAPTCTLSANPNNFPYGGGNTNLSWTTTNANSASIDQGIGAVPGSGSRSAFVGNSKTFTLTATGPGGSVTCNAPVTVAQPSVPTCTLSANPNNFPAGGGTSKLTWTTSNATSVSVNQGIGSVQTNGTVDAPVASSKTFTLTATGPGGTATCHAPVMVASPEVKCTLSASPNNFPAGGGSTNLSWTTEGANSVSIDQGVGSVGTNGSKSVSVTSGKTFTLTATGQSGTVQCQVQVSVSQGQCALEITKSGPGSANIGDTFEYTLNFKNIGSANCTGGGVHVKDTLPSQVQYASETHSPNVTAGYGGTNVYDAGSHTVHFNADVLTPGESGSVTIKVKVKSQQSCGNFTLENKGKISAAELNNFGTWVESNKVTTNVLNPCYQTPTCSLIVSPESVVKGGNARVDWNSSNVTHVVIKKIEGTSESTFQDTNAGSGSVIVTPTKDATYRGTFTGPGGTITCEDSVVVTNPNLTCAIGASPSSFPYGGGATQLSWNSTGADSASIDQGIGSVGLSGSQSVNVTTSKTFTLTVTNEGGSKTCSTPVTVAAPSAPTCTLYANPNHLPYGGGTTALTWTTQNADTVTINQGVGSVSKNGSQDVSVNTAKTFTLTATGPGGTVTCDTPITIATPSAPTCTLAAAPSNLPYGGGNTTLTWTTNNANDVSIDQGVGTVAEDGNQSVVVSASKTFKLTATGPGGTVTCQTPVTVGIQDFPTCSLSANPNNFPYGGGQSILSWATTNADSITIDQGVGSVSKNGSQNVNVAQTKTFRLTATNSRGSVVCNAPVTVGAPLQPTCGITITPDQIKKGENSRIDWTSTNADHVVIKKFVNGTETDFEDTNAGQGSRIISPDANATYKGTFTGPGGTVMCEDNIVVTTPAPLSCDSFTISPSTVDRGDNVTMNWNTSNADSVSINNGIGSVSVDGSKSVEAIEDRTYTLTAIRGNDRVTCEASVNVRSGGGGGSNPPRCEAFKASDTSIRAGETVKLSWETRRGTKLTIAPDIYTTTDDDKVKDGSVVVHPKKTTKYTLTVSKGSRKDTCTVTVKVSGFTVVSSREPLTSISFVEMPYTGFEAGPFLTGLFYVILTLWALAIAYVIVFERASILGLLFGSRRLTAAGSGVFIPHGGHALYSEHAVEEKPQLMEDVLPHFPEVAVDRSAPMNLPTYMPSEAHVEELLAEKKEMKHHDLETEANELIATLESVAHNHNVLLSSDALRLVIDHAETRDGSIEVLNDLIERAKGAYPREDGWIVLNRERVLALFKVEEATAKEPIRDVVVHTKPEGANTLAEAIVTGNTTRAYELLGTEPLSAIADAAEALDSIIRARKGQGAAPDMLMHASAMVTDEKLKDAVVALVAAIDGTYADQTAAVRLSVIKALKSVSQ